MITDERKQTMRDSIFRESLQLSAKPRFGMFSLPVSLAVGDDTYDKPKPIRKGADGNVVTDLRNFTTKNAKKGHIDSSLFSRPDYISIGDPFKESYKSPMRNS
jgi:hypothetical protein